MSKYLNLFLLLVWVWLTWVMLPADREQPQDIEYIKDGHEQPAQPDDAVQVFMKKLKGARETNETLYKRRHYNELPWYQRFGIWLEDEYDEYLEFLLYTFSSDPHNPQLANKLCRSEKSFSWESFKWGMLTGEYLLQIQFINIMLLIVFHRWILNRLAKIRAIGNGEKQKTAGRPSAGGRARRPLQARCIFGRLAKRLRGGRKPATIV